MQRNLEILTRVLSDKRISALIIVAAITARCLQLLFYLNSFFDTTFQVIATQNLVNGHGISTAIVNAGDLSATIYRPLSNWPPGYSILLAPFYLASGADYLIACFILDILAAASIILLTRKILYLLGVSTPMINLFTLLHGFFIYYFFFTGSTDSISIAFFLGAICLILRAIKDNDHWNTSAAGAGILLFVSAAMKYLFFPVAFVLPVFLFIYGYQNRLTSARRAAWISFLATGTGIAVLYFFQQSISGTGAYISAPGRGFFPEHLLRVHPFFPSAFLTPNTTGLLAGSAKDTVMNLFRLAHMLFFTVFLVAATRFLFRSGLRNAAPARSFLFLAYSLMLAIMLVLALLSLLVDKELIPPDRWWTYIEDARYYGLGDILMHLCVFVLFSAFRKQLKGFLQMIIFALPFLLLPEAIRGFAFTAKRAAGLGKEAYYWKQELAFQRFVDAAVQPVIDSFKVKKVVITGSLYYASYRTSQYRQAPVLEDLAALKVPSSLKTTEPVVLLVMLSEDSRRNFQGLANDPRTRFAGVYNGFYFYTLYVTPG